MALAAAPQCSLKRRANKAVLVALLLVLAACSAPTEPSTSDDAVRVEGAELGVTSVAEASPTTSEPQPVETSGAPGYNVSSCAAT